MSGTHITPEMEQAVGRVFERLVSFPISESDIRRWVVAGYHPEVPPREFWDAGYAADTTRGGIVAPHEFNPFAWLTVEPAGLPPRIDSSAINRTEESLGISGPNLAQGLNGGVEVEYGARMRPGDVITSETKLASYHEREGRLGLMLFTRTEASWTNQNDELVKRTVSTLIRY